MVTIWKYTRYSYLAKRGNKLFLTILIELEKKNSSEVSWILTRCIVKNKDVIIDYSLLNNSEAVQLNDIQRKLVIDSALKIAKTYMK